MMMTVTDACETRLEEVIGVLRKYNISDWDMDVIKSAIIAVHFELIQASKAGRILEAMLSEACKELGRDVRQEAFFEFMKRSSKLDEFETEFAERFAHEIGLELNEDDDESSENA